MIRTLKKEQLKVYLESNDYMISDENEKLALISNQEGEMVAMYWKEKEHLEELTDDDSIFQQPIKKVAMDAIVGGALFTLSALLVSSLVIVIFG